CWRGRRQRPESAAICAPARRPARDSLQESIAAVAHKAMRRYPASARRSESTVPEIARARCHPQPAAPIPVKATRASAAIDRDSPTPTASASRQMRADATSPAASVAERSAFEIFRRAGRRSRFEQQNLEALRAHDFVHLLKQWLRLAFEGNELIDDK